MSGSWGAKAGEKPSEQCSLYAPSLAAFADGALPPEEATAVAAHVARCGWCAGRIAAYAEVDALVREAPMPSPPPALRAGLYARIAAAQAQAAAQASTRHPTAEGKTRVRELHTKEVPATAAPPATQPPHRSPSPLAVRSVSAAAVLIVVLLVGLFATQRHSQTTAPASHPTATAIPQRACAPNEIQASLPARSSFGDLAMTGPSTGWAVGGFSDADTVAATQHALILRYANCRWEPFGPSLANAWLGSIAMVSPSEGWATGEQLGAPLLLHYKDGTWSRVTPPALGAPYTIYAFDTVRALATGEVWIIGPTPAGTHQNTGIAILRLSGGRWTRIETPFNAASDLALVGPGDAWLIGTKDPNHTTNGIELAHFQGGALTQEVPLDQRDYPTSLHMLAPNDGWATGYVYVSGDETSSNPTVNHPLALHYDGSTWTVVNTGASPDALGLVVLGQGEAWSFTRTTTIPQYVNATQREHAGKWQTVPWPFKNADALDSMTCVTVDDCWAIGRYSVPGTTLPNGNVSFSVATKLLRYTNGAWYEYGPGA